MVGFHDSFKQSLFPGASMRTSFQALAVLPAGRQRDQGIAQRDYVMSGKIGVCIPIDIDRFLTETSGLTTEHRGAYLLLMFDYWQSGPPPDQPVALSKIARLSRSKWKKADKALRPYFFVQGGLWTHPGIDDLLHDVSVQPSVRAKNAAKSRWSLAE